nr:pectinesterase family protein [uncultured Roseateles sp.]
MRRWLGLMLMMCGIAQAQLLAQDRPQLSDSQAAAMTQADYLGDWHPPALQAQHWRADFIVAADGSGSHRSLQAAIDALPAQGRRHYIQLKPGRYREQVCAHDKAPFTLYGQMGDAAAVQIVHGHFSSEPKAVGTPANRCTPDLAASQYGTAGSATLAIFSDDVQLAHLSVVNDAMDAVREGQGYPPAVGESGGAQAVALMTEGDRLQLQDVRLLGHQDTFFVRAKAQGGAARVWVQASWIAGDVDFIFGNGTLVISDSTLLSRAGRRVPGSGGYVLAPSTAPQQAYGMLVQRSRLLAEAGVAPASIALGRAWDAGVGRGAWQAGVSPNGQALIRDSLLGPHLRGWGASTSRRPFDAATQRLSEYRNQLTVDSGLAQ